VQVSCASFLRVCQGVSGVSVSFFSVNCDFLRNRARLFVGGTARRSTKHDRHHLSYPPAIVGGAVTSSVSRARQETNEILRDFVLSSSHYVGHLFVGAESPPPSKLCRATDKSMTAMTPCRGTIQPEEKSGQSRAWYRYDPIDGDYTA